MNRVFDILFSIFILLLTFPLAIVIAIIVKLSSRGPVFYVQERIGRGEKPFHLYKFRSMRSGYGGEGTLLTVKDDSRITGVGHFLRRFKLDELPQFLNVLFGDMSVVGPRPEVPKYVKSYTPEMRRVFDYRPGITDPASIQFRDEPALLAASKEPEATYLEEILPQKVNMSLRYLARRTLLSDIGVILRTISIMLGR